MYFDSQVTLAGEDSRTVHVRTLPAHIHIFVWKGTPECREVFAFDTWKQIHPFRIDAVLSARVFRNGGIRAMTAQLVGVVHPPTCSMFRMIARVIVRTSANLTNSVCHNLILFCLCCFIHLFLARERMTIIVVINIKCVWNKVTDNLPLLSFSINEERTLFFDKASDMHDKRLFRVTLSRFHTVWTRSAAVQHLFLVFNFFHNSMPLYPSVSSQVPRRARGSC